MLVSGSEIKSQTDLVVRVSSFLLDISLARATRFTFAATTITAQEPFRGPEGFGLVSFPGPQDYGATAVYGGFYKHE